MRFSLTIEGGNDAMRRRTDVAKALRDIAYRLGDSDWEIELAGIPIYDMNGDRVGSWTYEPEEDEDEADEDDAP